MAINKSAPRILITLYGFFLIVIISLLITSLIPQEVTTFYFPVGILYRTFFNIVIIALSIIIFVRANRLYNETNDRKFAVIAGGFLAGSILLLEEVIFFASYSIKNISITNSQILYYIIGRIAWSAAIFISVFYSGVVRQHNNPEKFKKIIYAISMLYAIIILFLDQFLSPYMLNFSYRILPNLVLLRLTEQGFFLLAGFIYTDLRIVNGKSFFSKFTLGLFTLGIGPLFFIAGHSTTLFALILPLIRIVGFILIFLGLNELKEMETTLNFRQKLSAYLSLLLLLSYMAFIPVISFALNIIFPIFSAYMFLAYFISATIILYGLSARYTQPITNLIQGMERYNPQRKPEYIKPISCDEIGMLTKKINEVQALVWQYTQDLLDKSNQLVIAKHKEQLLREIIQSVSDIIDIRELKNKIVSEIGIALNADRVFLIDYDSNSNSFLPVRVEYLSSSDVKSSIGFEVEQEAKELSLKRLRQEDIIIHDIDKFIKENNLVNTASETHLRDYNVKSGFSIGIYYFDILYGSLVIHFTSKKQDFSNEDINFAKTLANQIGIAIHQSNLFNKVIQTAEREKLLRDLISAIRSTLDLNIIKNILVTEVAKYFNADRVFLTEYDNERDLIRAPDKFSEYRPSNNISSLIPEPPETFECFKPVLKNKIDLIINDTEQFIQKHKETFPSIEKYFKKINSKSGIGIPIIYGNEIIGALVIQYTKEKHLFSNEEIELTKTLANQTGIAYHQAKLYNTVKETADRERLLRDLISTLRSTLDINKIKNIFINEIGRTFNADRCFFAEFDSKYNVFLPVDKYSEYLSSTEIKDTIGDDLEQYTIFTDALKKGEEIIIPDVQEFIKNNSQAKTAINYLEKYNLTSGIGLPILYGEQVQGLFTVQYTREKRNFPEQDLNFLRTLAAQAGLAFYQAKLYETVRINGEHEKILREIVSNIKLSQTTDEVYDYILEKLTEIYNSDRALFIEIPQLKGEKPFISREFKRDENLPNIKSIQLPRSCIKTFEEIAEKQFPIAIENTEDHYKEDIETQTFFNLIMAKSSLFAPLVKYDHETQVLGLFAVCLKTARKWNDNDKNLLKEIADSAVTILWEINKQNEVEELRNTFMVTLAHDLQVPLVGEHKALEFLSSRPPNQEIGRYIEIIHETMDSNEKITDFLKKLLHSYSYESGKQKLEYGYYDLTKIITEISDLFSNTANSKNISIELKLVQNLPKIKLDLSEIITVISILLDNAITYTPNNGQVTIETYSTENYITVCIIDNGPGLPAELKDKVFQRYSMAQIIGRKIGAGLSLYLAKQIIDAHQGKIWYIQQDSGGSKFCFNLPL